MATTHTVNKTDGQEASQLVALNGAPYAENAIVQGYKRLGLTQAQVSATKAFGRLNPFKADEWLVLTELGMTKVLDMPDESELRFEAPGTNLPARADIFVPPTPPENPTSIPAQDGGYADDFAWGYRILTRAVYNNVIGAMHLMPRLVLAHT